MNKNLSAKGGAVWFTGLPGCGKSSISRNVCSRLKDLGINAYHLQMDERRKAYFPEPDYSSRERQKAYELFADEGARLAQQGMLVIMDGTAPRKEMRDRARRQIDRFAEIHVDCSLETAMSREQNRPQGLVMADLYAKALERKKTGRRFPGLGQVIGVDVPFEKDPAAELVIDNQDLSLEEAVEQAVNYLQQHFL
ncbi:MAG: adenylyl-sulfate kinase, partial [Desulfonatronovibrionaceae bacterium]